MNGNGAGISVWPIALLRIYTGVFFAKYGIDKIGRDEFNIQGFLQGRLDSAFGFYQPLLENVFIPNAALFSFLVAWGELALGIALILGAATRYAAFAGAFMVANFWFAKGQGFLDAQNHDVMWIMILLVLALVPAGRVLGLDQQLSRRFKFLR